MSLTVKYVAHKLEAQNAYTEFIHRHYSEVERRSIHFSDLQSESFRGTLVVQSGQEILALNSIFYNEHLMFQGKKTLCFGYYECVDDADVAKLLNESLEDRARQDDFELLLGPLNGSTWNNYRFSESFADGLFFTERLHKSYYLEQLRALDYFEVARYASHIDRDLQLLQDAKSRQVHDFWSQRNLTIRSIDMAAFDDEIARIHLFCLAAFKNNFLYTPIDIDWFRGKYKAVEHLIDPNFVFLAEEAGELVGLLFAIPDFYAVDEKRLIVKTIAKKPGRAYAGITHLLGEALVERAKSESYTALIHAFMYVDNASAQVSKHFSGALYRNYSLVAKTIKEDA
jgi:hypothetical protein